MPFTLPLTFPRFNRRNLLVPEKKYLCDSLPEEVVQKAKVEIAAVALKPECHKPSLAQTADHVGLSIGELNSIRAKYKIDIQQIREDLAGIQIGNGYIASKELSKKLQDPEVIAELRPKDLAAIAKQSFDSGLNLSNGQTQSSNLHFHFGDLKALKELREMQKPEIKVKTVDAEEVKE